MRLLAGSFALSLAACWWLAAQPAAGPKLEAPPQLRIAPAPHSQKLTFNVVWRLIHAGSVTLETQATWVRLTLQSAGMLSKLYKVDDTYTANFEEPFCATSAVLDAKEGKRHRETRVTYDRGQRRAFFTERDLESNALVHSADVEIPDCVLDVIGGLVALRGMAGEPGRTVEVPTSDGRRAAVVKIEAQEREQIKTPAGSFHAIRYEAGIFNGVVYPRKGRALVWMSDDARHLPVQIVLRMNFPIGTVTLELEKEEQHL
jgi:hypothetical protein